MPRGENPERHPPLGETAARAALELHEIVLALSSNMQALLRRFFFAIALLALGGCSAASAESAGNEGDDSGGGTSGTGGSAGAMLTVAFEGENPLELEPSVTQELTVAITPTEPRQTVRFALLAGVDADGMPGSVADAALGLTETTTDELGKARVILSAPSIPTEFDVRALADTVQDTLHVVVGSRERETLAVDHSYVGGRPVSEWIVEVYPNRTCTELEGNPPEAPNPRISRTFPYTPDTIFIEDVPVRVKLAVTLRAEHFAGGCSGIDAVVEGQANTVFVTVTNRPIQLDRSDVALRLGLAGQEEALAGSMASVVEAARDAMLGGAASDTEALLDAMQEVAQSDSSCASFSNARGSNRWDTELATALGTAGASSIRDDLGGWLTASVPSLASDDAILGRLTAEPTVMGGANLAFETVAGFRARDAGFPANVLGTWTADPRDNVSLGATIPFNPAALLVLAAEEPATNAVPAGSTLAEALALRGARCDNVTQFLTTHGEGVGLSCVGCNAACTRALCERGLEALVSRASNALADEPAELRIAAIGSAEVGSEAELRVLDGSWVGALDAANRSSELAGDLAAEAAAP
jgi:hypothetical protein